MIYHFDSKFNTEKNLQKNYGPKMNSKLATFLKNRHISKQISEVALLGFSKNIRHP